MNNQEQSFLSVFVEKLRATPAWLNDQPASAIWLDRQRRLNTCRVRELQPGSSRVRITINHHIDSHARAFLNASTMGELSPARPAWKLELICLEEELEPFAEWLAAVVDRREGLVRRLPAPPCPLLNWADESRLDNYVQYLSTISLQSERAFADDVRCAWRRPVHYVGRGHGLSLPLAG